MWYGTIRHGRVRPRRGTIGALALAALLSSTLIVAADGSGGAATEKVDKSAVLRIGEPINEQGGVFFDPANGATNPYARQYLDLIYDTMIRQTPDGKGIPALATKWSAPDSSTAELTLREGVKFSDGQPFNAAAVKAAWDRNRTSTLTPIIPPTIKAITSIEAIGDTTVRVHFGQPIAQKFLDEDAKNSQWLGVPSPAAIAAGTVSEKPVGAGPYVLESNENGQKIVLGKNKTYWDPKVQQLDGYEFQAIPFGVPAVSALQAGTIDLTWGIGTASIDAIENTPGLTVTATPGTRINDIGLCATEGIFASKDARQAMQYAIDRKAMNKAGLNDLGTVTVLPLTKLHPGYDKSLEKSYSYNPKKAKALLDKAGVAPGTTVTALVSTNAPMPVMAEIVERNLEKVGLKMSITPSVDIPGDAATKPWDMNFVAMDPQLFPFAFEGTSRSALNVCQWANPELRAALATTRDGTKTAEEQNAAWQRFQEILVDESPVIFHTTNPVLTAHKDTVKGVTMNENPSGPILYPLSITK